MTNKLTALLLLLLVFKGNAQVIDSSSIVKQHDKLALKQFIVPAALVTSGALLLHTQANQNVQNDIRNQFGSDFHTSVDNYIQLAPVAQIYAGKYLGFKPKNDFVHQTINIAVANAIMGTLVTVMKHSFQEERPDGSNNLSYPSGHTATAFTNASLLFYEYKDANLWYASS